MRTPPKYAQNIVDTVREPLIILNEDLRVVSANRSFYSIFRVKPKETEGKLIYDIGNRQWNIPALRKLLEDILPKRTVFKDFKVTHDFPSIGRRTMVLNARKLRGETDKKEMILLAIEDVTERTAMENALKASEDRFRRVFETSLDSWLLVHKREGRILNSNPSATKLLGYAKGEFLRKKIWQIGLVKDKASFRKAEKILESEGVFSYEDIPVRTKKGSTISADVHLVNRAKVIQCNIRNITSRKASEDVIKVSEKKYRGIIEATQDGFWYVDMEGHFLDVNRAACRMLGYTRDELLKMKISDIEILEKQKDVVRHIKYMEKYGGDRFETKHRNKSGSLIDVEVSTNFMKDEQGQGRVLVFIRDITERKLAEDRLRDSEARFRSIFDNASDGIAIVEPKTRKFYMCNSRMAEILGRDDRELDQITIEDIHPPNAFPHILRQFNLAVSGRINIIPDVPILKKDGKTIPFDIMAFELDMSGKKYIAGIFRDVAERNKAEKILALSEAKYKSFYESSRDGYVLTDMKGRIIEYNESYRQMLGFPGRELNDKTYIELTPLKWRKMEAGIVKNEVMKKGYSVPYEKEYIRKDGIVIPIELVTYLKRDENGKAIGLWAFVRDITEKKREERMRDELVRNLSHELKTPLAILEMSFGILNRSIEAGDMEKVRSSRKVFFHSVSRLKKDVSNIIDLFSLRTGYMSREISYCDLRGVLDNVLQNLEFAMKEKGVKVSVDIRKGAEQFYINKNALRTILFNIIDNAVKFTERGGITIRSRKMDGYAEIDIKDTGIGVKPEYIPHIFEPFSKGHPSLVGAGVGLTICRDIVGMYGGKISISSPGPGLGTSVVVRLPLKRMESWAKAKV